MSAFDLSGLLFVSGTVLFLLAALVANAFGYFAYGFVCALGANVGPLLTMLAVRGQQPPQAVTAAFVLCLLFATACWGWWAVSYHRTPIATSRALIAGIYTNVVTNIRPRPRVYARGRHAAA